MQADQVRQLINKILVDVEEEDIGISLLSRQYQTPNELDFFKDEDRKAVFQILEKLSQDSERHKKMLYELVDFLGGELREP